MKIQYTTPDQPDYPPQWKELSHWPPRAAYWGEPVWLNHHMISVVGSRTPMQDTVRWMENHLTTVFNRRSLAVVSGGARGVDQLAHRLSMQCQRPTVCVLPSGIRDPYPYGIRPFLEDIVRNGGAVISTFSDDEPIKTQHFGIRNRWIAGFSKICFVAEANRRSGSILTAKLALQEQREVVTLPVSPFSAQGLGNLDLLADGAQIVRDGEDLDALWGLHHPW